jgi:hypothetical protein
MAWKFHSAAVEFTHSGGRMALLDMAQQYLGQNEVAQISQQLGINPALAQTAIAAALPMIVGGMARHAANPEVADVIQEAARAHQDVPDDVGSVLQAGPPADVSDGGGLLGRIFGQHRDTVQQGVQQASGLDSEKAKKLLMMLSPVVLGVLARHQFGGQNATQANPGAIAGTLQQEAQTAQRQSPHLGGVLGNILGAMGG